MEAQQEKPSTASRCPVGLGRKNPLIPTADTTMSAAAASSQVHQSDVLDGRNNMPSPNQIPAPDQLCPLNTDRVVSTIPKTGTDQTWDYPSEQIFFNALRRKGWDARENDMRAVVGIHNAVNEKAWQQILHWEAMHQGFVKTLLLSDALCLRMGC